MISSCSRNSTGSNISVTRTKKESIVNKPSHSLEQSPQTASCIASDPSPSHMGTGFDELAGNGSTDERTLADPLRVHNTHAAHG